MKRILLERAKQIMRKSKEKNKNDYKVIISELGSNPFQIIKLAFALMCIIPLLVVFYIVMGKNFLYNIFLGNNGLEMVIAMLVAFTGLLYAYNLVRTLIEKLLKYAEERRLADDEKTELLVTVASDLKTPLTALKLGISDLLSGAGACLGGAHAEIAKGCRNAVETISKFIEGIMDLPKTGFIRMNERREFIDFRDIITTEVKGVVQLAKNNGLDLQCTYVTNNANLWGDEQKLSKAVMNLLVNVIKYTPHGGRVNIGVLSDVDTVQFSIVHSGPGFLPGEINRIFEKSEKPGMNSEINETTLDLSIVKDIIDLHSGHITINSEPNKNTEFKVILPRDLRTRSGMLDGMRLRDHLADT